MVAENLIPKYEAQTAELYRSFGMFVVRFEHLMYATKQKIQTLCGYGQEVTLLLEPYTARQSIDMLADLIRQRSTEAEIAVDPADSDLFKQIISDLRSINTERNRVVHTMWYIGWSSDTQTDFSTAAGHKFSSKLNFKLHEISPSMFEELTRKSDSLYSVLYTVWPIDALVRMPSLSALYSRSSEGIWSRR